MARFFSLRSPYLSLVLLYGFLSSAGAFLVSRRQLGASENIKRARDSRRSHHEGDEAPLSSPMDMNPMLSEYLQSTQLFRTAGWLVRTFARAGRRRAPTTDTPSSTTHHIRLISIPVSPYVEKIRWGLDLLGAYYTEECHPPGVCAYYSAAASDNRASQSPMIVLQQNDTATDDDKDNHNNVLWGSDTILQHLFVERNGQYNTTASTSSTMNLYPIEIRKEVLQWEHDLGEQLGASVRCLAYQALLDPSSSQSNFRRAVRVICQDSPRIERLLYTALLYKGDVWQVLSEELHVNDPQVLAHSERQVRRLFDELSQRLERACAAHKDEDDVYIMDTPTKRYGCTAVDITFASFAFWLIRPPELAPLYGRLFKSPLATDTLGRELRATRAGQHILRVYRKHRPVSHETGCIALQRVNQNRIPLLMS